MNTAMKYFTIVTIALAVAFVPLLAYGGYYMQSLTWVFLGISGYFNYQSIKSLEEIKQ